MTPIISFPHPFNHILQLGSTLRLAGMERYASCNNEDLQRHLMFYLKSVFCYTLLQQALYYSPLRFSDMILGVMFTVIVSYKLLLASKPLLVAPQEKRVHLSHQLPDRHQLTSISMSRPSFPKGEPNDPHVMVFNPTQVSRSPTPQTLSGKRVRFSNVVSVREHCLTIGDFRLCLPMAFLEHPICRSRLPVQLTDEIQAEYKTTLMSSKNSSTLLFPMNIHDRLGRLLAAGHSQLDVERCFYAFWRQDHRDAFNTQSDQDAIEFCRRPDADYHRTIPANLVVQLRTTPFDAPMVAEMYRYFQNEAGAGNAQHEAFLRAKKQECSLATSPGKSGVITASLHLGQRHVGGILRYESKPRPLQAAPSPTSGIPKRTGSDENHISRCKPRLFK